MSKQKAAAAKAPTPAPAPSKKGVQLTKQEEVALLADSINKKFKGNGAILNGSQFRNVFMLRRPTGITTLDLALGGGFPAGGLSQIIGKDSSGKSWLVNQVFRLVQATYGPKACLAACMTEMRFDKHFAKWQCGVKVALGDDEIAWLEHCNRQNGLPPFTPEQLVWLREQMGVFQEVIMATAEQVLEAAVQLVESNLYQVVLIDSFGALLTKAEAEAEKGLEDKHRGGAAMVVTQFMHRLHAALNLPDKHGNPNTTTVIGINQYRDNVGGGLYGPKMQIAGGYALRHGKLVDLHLEQGSKNVKELPGGEKVVLGKEIRWELIKGKAGCHDGPRGAYQFMFGTHGNGFGANIYEDLLVAGVRNGVVEQSGAWYVWPPTSEKFQGTAQFIKTLHENQQFFFDVRKAVFDRAGLKFITNEDEVT